MRGPTLVDQATAFQAASAILAALVGRKGSGEGARIDISMIDSAIGFIPDVHAAHTDAGLKIDTTSRAAGSQAFVMACGDGKLIAVQLGGPQKNWIGLTNAISRPDIAEDERFRQRSNRVANWLVLIEELRPVFKTHPRSVWLERLIAADLPCSEVRDISEVMDGSEVKHSNLFETKEHPQAGAVTMLKRVARINGSRGPEQPLPAVLGEHNNAILRDLGYAPEEIDRLTGRGAFG